LRLDKFERVAMYTQVVQTLGGALERRYLSRSVSERKAKIFRQKATLAEPPSHFHFTHHG
jgi:hypothetical protein